MPNIVDRFGQLVDDAIPKPELARQLLLLGYRAKDVQLLLAPEKELTQCSKRWCSAACCPA